MDTKIQKYARWNETAACQRFWIATFNFNDILTLAASWFFVILTSLMRESQQLQEEHDTTV